MRAREPQWARFAKAAVGAPRPVVPPSRPHRLRQHLRALGSRLAEAHDTRGISPARSRADMRLLPAVSATWLTAVIAITWEGPWLAGAAALMGGSLVAGAALTWLHSAVAGAGSRRRGADGPASRGRGRDRGPLAAAMATVLVAAVCVTAVLTAVGLRQAASASSALEQAVVSGGDLSLTVEVGSMPRRLETGHGPARLIFDAVVVSATDNGRMMTGRVSIRVVAAANWGVVHVGDKVSTAGRITPPGTNGQTVGFHTVGFLHPATAPLHVVPVQSGPQVVVVPMRKAWVQSVKRVWMPLSTDASGLLPGMVMGDRSGIDATLNESMKTTGLTHLTAVSGANCTLVLASLMLLVRSLRAPRQVAVLASGAGLVGFVVLVGPDPSVLRAAVMGAIGALAVLGGRPKRVGALLCVTVVVLLLADPWLAMDYAFILSVLATLGIHLVGRRCVDWLAVWWPVWLAQAVAIPLAAQLFCAPVMVLLAPRLTPYTIPANMLAAPVVALVTTVGTFGLAVAAVVPLIGSLCAFVSGLGAWWVAAIARWMAGLPAASLPWPAGLEGVVLMAAVNAAALAALFALVEQERAKAAAVRLTGFLPARWRAHFGFGTVVVLAAAATAWWCAAVLDP